MSMRFKLAAALGILSLIVVPARSVEPQEAAAEAVYQYDASGKVRSFGDTRLGPEGFLDVDGDQWVVERFDSLCRPVSRVTWKASVIVSTTIWLYNPAESGYTLRTESGGQHTETVYSETGLPLFSTVRDSEGLLLESYAREYTADDKLLSEKLVIGTRERLTENRYSGEGELEFTRITENQVPVLEREYQGAENWVERVFYRGKPVLEVTWRDSVRVGENKLR